MPASVEGAERTRYVGRVRRASFVVRVVRDRQGKVSGVIARVATGAKEAFQGMEAIGPVIARMVERDVAAPGSAGTSTMVGPSQQWRTR
jgi:hypothetical protein